MLVLVEAGDLILRCQTTTGRRKHHLQRGPKINHAVGNGAVGGIRYAHRQVVSVYQRDYINIGQDDCGIDRVCIPS